MPIPLALLAAGTLAAGAGKAISASSQRKALQKAADKIKPGRDLGAMQQQITSSKLDAASNLGGLGAALRRAGGGKGLTAQQLVNLQAPAQAQIAQKQAQFDMMSEQNEQQKAAEKRNLELQADTLRGAGTAAMLGAVGSTAMDVAMPVATKQLGDWAKTRRLMKTSEFGDMATPKSEDFNLANYNKLWGGNLTLGGSSK